MPRHARRRLLPLAAVGLAALLTTAGCGGGGPALPSGGSATPAPRSATASATARASALTAAQLRFSLPVLPPGAKPWAASAGPTGTLTPSQYATAEFGAADAAKDLPVEVQRGLTFAALENWRQTNGVAVEVFLVHYATHDGALSAFLAFKADEQQNDAGDTDFTMPDAVDSFAVASPTLDSSGNATTNLHAVAGEILIRVAVSAPATPDQVTTLAVAKQAYAKLCTLVDCAAGSES